ncbi:hypothetical protein SVAN01_10690 [Stagonosporopsis vannaccii]|nr:hypothetical protein SVAN01_10690 [Stagonosporopsis vannaccii]
MHTHTSLIYTASLALTYPLTLALRTLKTELLQLTADYTLLLGSLATLTDADDIRLRDKFVRGAVKLVREKQREYREVELRIKQIEDGAVRAVRQIEGKKREEGGRLRVEVRRLWD